jgi:hypothetical protein
MLRFYVLHHFFAKKEVLHYFRSSNNNLVITYRKLTTDSTAHNKAKDGLIDHC